MSFLVPAFLAGLLAIAIPVWVHLRNRQKTKTIEFPSLMFLQRVPYRSVQRQTLRHRLLFGLRTLALVLLAIAFARPFLGHAVVSANGSGGARELVVMLDRSWSMRYGDHWDNAVDAVEGVIGEAAAVDLVSLILFDEEASVLVQSSPDRSALRAALGAARPGNATTSYAAGFRAAERILAASSLPRREAVIVSDFQRGGWDPEAGIELPQGTVVRPFSVAGPTDNIAVADVTLRRLSVTDTFDEQVGVVARLTRQGGADAREVVVQLLVDDDVAGERRVRLPPSGALRVQFDPVPLGERPVRGVVRVGTDALADDNEFFFVAVPGQAIRVLILDNPEASGTDSFFVARALRLGTDPGFEVETAALSDLAPPDLARRRLLILNDVGTLDPATTGVVREFLEAGGGVFMAVAELTPEMPTAGLLPFAVGPPVDRTVELGATLSYLDTSHPALELFAGPDGGDFGSARFYRYRELVPSPSRGVLARFDDGAPALVQLRVGAGTMLVWTSSLDSFWSDFPRQPVFLPFLHELAEYAAGYRQPPAWLTAGRTLSTREVLLAASGGRVADAAAVDADTAAGVDTAASPPGFQTIDWTEANGTRGSSPVAFNLARSESDLSPADPEEIAAATIWRAGGRVENGAESVATAEQIESRQSAWWYLLLLALLLLILEAALSNRLSPRAS